MSKVVDLLVHSGYIYPLGGSYESVEALAIDRGRIIATGSLQSLDMAFQPRKRLDLSGSFIFPAFHDPHCHLHRYAREQMEVDLRGCASEEAMLERLLAFSKRQPHSWIVGRGWDQNQWPERRYPTRKLLDEYFPDRPVYLERIDIHAAVVNTFLLEQTDLRADSEIEGGEIIVEGDWMTGCLIDNARNPVLQLLPEPNERQWEEALISTQQKLWSMGLVALGDALLSLEEAERLARLQRKGLFQMPVYGMLPADEKHLQRFLPVGPQRMADTYLGAFKLFADGTLGSRGAWLLEPYSDDASQHGLQLLPWEETLELVRRIHDAGFQLCIHAIGDAANRQAVDLCAAVLNPGNDRRWRIEHCQMMLDKEVAKIQQYQLLPSVQPTHAVSDAAWVADRIGLKRLQYSYPGQRLYQACERLVLGTDFPVESPDPLATFFAATQGPANSMNWRAKEQISRKAALSGMTEWAAFSAFWEWERGNLKEGKSADFVVLDRNLLGESIFEGPRPNVLQCWNQGKVVFSQ